ncbi:MAG: 1-acyl-sn-glycerol-3-phosphate acyltransferase [Clostridia bacterium]|nr:1-acyl-sn-glycerol-3-phosphate acyltransferase [Clostridia bacterium]
MKLYSFIRALVWLPVRLSFNMRVEGRENIPEEAFLLCANHISAVDPLILAIAFPMPVRFVAKEEILKIPFLRLIGKIDRMIPVARGTADLKAMRACMNAINEGDNVGIFPQGTRTEGKPQAEQALPGTGLIIMRTKAPVVPVSIMAKDNKIRLFRKTRVVIGKPVSYEEYSTAGSSAEAAKFCFKRVCDRF